MQLPANWQLPDEINRRFGQRGAGKQRAMLAEQHLLLVLHKLPQPGSRQRQGIFFGVTLRAVGNAAKGEKVYPNSKNISKTIAKQNNSSAKTTVRQ